MVATRGSVHNAGLVLVVFVGIMAFEPPIHRDHSMQTNIDLGHPVLHPRPFRWWNLFGGYLGSIMIDCCLLAILLGVTVYWLMVPFFRVFPLFLFSLLVWMHHLIVALALLPFVLGSTSISYLIFRFHLGMPHESVGGC
jgi:hypothetical protein